MHTFVLASPLLSTATTTESHLTMAVVEDTQSACRLSESERTLHASKQAQQRLQQQLAECKAELEEASVRADAAHSEALSYGSRTDRLSWTGQCVKNLQYHCHYVLCMQQRL